MCNKIACKLSSDRDEPFIPNVAWWMKRQAFCRKIIVELSDQRFERCPFKIQAEGGNAALEKFRITQRRPVGSFHLAHAITQKTGVTPLREVQRRMAAFDRRHNVYLPISSGQWIRLFRWVD